MAKALLVATIGAVCWIGPLTAQGRPDFSGAWTLEPARSAPSGSGLFGTTFTASQDATTLEIARETTMAAVPVGGGPVRASKRIWREVFRLDGETWRDRVASGSRPPDLTWPQDEPTRPYRVKVALLDSVTSATWAGGRLVSTTYRASRLSAPDREPTEWVQRQTIRLTLGLEPDGLLAVERLLIEDPSPWDSGRQEAPRIIRSVYRRDGARQSPPSRIEPADGAWAAFSRLITTSEGRDAVVDYEYWCGTLCGIGQLLWLHRDRATAPWRVAGRATSWIS